MKKLYFNKLLILIAAISVTVSTQAQEAQRIQDNKEEAKRYYVGFEYGQAKTNDISFQNSAVVATSVGGVTTSSSQDTKTNVGRLFLGYHVNEMLAIEGGYFASGDIKYNATGIDKNAIPYSSNATSDYQGMGVAAVWSPLAAKAGDSSPFLKAGLHYAKATSNSTVERAGSIFTSEDKRDGIGTFFGVGYNWKFSEFGFMRVSASRYLKIAGESDNKVTLVSLGFGAQF